MTRPSLSEVILTSQRFRDVVSALAIQSVLQDLQSISPPSVSTAIDWDYALLCASGLTMATSEEAQEAALRITQGCLASPDALDHQREAAAVLLERMGNRPALELAERRELVPGEAWSDAPVPLQLDVMRRRMELSIPLSGGGAIAASPFQRAFWSAATTSDWLSVSAPTSAGKSFIVKRWLEEQFGAHESFRGVYLVPTRALIEEVSHALTSEFPSDVSIFTLPWDSGIDSSSREIYVVTQERLHLLQQRLPDFAADLLFVDEAQKFGDDSRGVLLQRVLDEAVRRKPAAQVLFASPLSQNPEILLAGAPPEARVMPLASRGVTVNQNLLWANQVPQFPRRWQIQLIAGGDPVDVGEVELPARPTPDTKRLTLVAVALGRDEPGNVVYVNGAAAAEKAALQIAEALGEEGELRDDPDIEALRELVQKTIHPQYALVSVLQRGVAFHYGNMPLLIRAEIERLFRAGTLRYLVCTSTLLEGVNLPCRNLFARGPKNANNRIMSSADFWNLAGRAGRWGKEFQGNIVCVDTSSERQWPTPPRRRVRQPLSRASDAVMRDTSELKSYIASGTPIAEGRDNPVLESVFSLLATRVAEGVSITSIPGLSVTPDEAVALEDDIRAVLENVDVAVATLARHAGISPLSMQYLLNYFRGKEDQSELVLAAPESDDAAESYVRALSRVTRFLGGPFGVPGRQWVLSVLIVNWMRGRPLSQLIGERVSYYSNRDDERSLASIIRSTMEDVEQIARFEAPKYLACYADILGEHLRETGQAAAAEDLPDLAMMLELGVSRTTELSLMTLGLSRTSAVALSSFIVPDDLLPAGCVEWLRGRDLSILDLPVLVRREIEAALQQA